MKAIEITGTVDEQSQLLLDNPLPISGPRRVRIIILTEEIDIDEEEWLQVATANSAFDFLKKPEEDIYSLDDGKQFYDQR